MRRLLLIWLLTLLGVVGAAAVAEEPDTNQQFTLTCSNATATVFVGDHHLGMAHIRIDRVDPWFEPSVPIRNGVTHVQVGDASFVEVWVTLDGDEVDLGAQCFSVTTTSAPTTTQPPTTTKPPSTTKPSRPATTTTTSTTTTSLPPTTVTTVPSTTTTIKHSEPAAGCDTHTCCVDVCHQCPTLTSDTSSGLSEWVWPVTLGWFGLLGAVIAGLFLRAGYIIGPSQFRRN